MISVIIPTYNRYDYLCNAIASVRAQTYKNKEIIVVDDSSTDIRYSNNIFTKNYLNLCVPLV